VRERGEAGVGERGRRGEEAGGKRGIEGGGREREKHGAGIHVALSRQQWIRRLLLFFMMAYL
jgi:hypothetical protein